MAQGGIFSRSCTAWPWLWTHGESLRGVLLGHLLCCFFGILAPKLIFAASSSLRSLYSAWTLALCTLGNCLKAEGNGACLFYFTCYPLLAVICHIYFVSSVIVAYGRRVNSMSSSTMARCRPQPHLRMEIKSLEALKFFTLICGSSYHCCDSI